MGQLCHDNDCKISTHTRWTLLECTEHENAELIAAFCLQKVPTKNHTLLL